MSVEIAWGPNERQGDSLCSGAAITNIQLASREAPGARPELAVLGTDAHLIEVEGGAATETLSVAQAEALARECREYAAMPGQPKGLRGIAKQLGDAAEVGASTGFGLKVLW